MATFVLIPGAGGDGWYWHRLEPLLRARGHDVVSVTLPSGDEHAGLQEYADTVIAAIGDRRDLVLVASSMAGFTAPLVAERVRLQSIVFLNAMIPLPGETPGAWWGNTGQEDARRAMDTREGRDPDAPFDVTTYFMHDLPHEVVDEMMARGEPAQADRPFGTPATFKSWPEQVPLHVLSARDDRLLPADFQRRVAEERLGITPDVLPGGHLVALSQPAALADRLLTYA